MSERTWKDHALDTVKVALMFGLAVPVLVVAMNFVEQNLTPTKPDARDIAAARDLRGIIPNSSWVKSVAISPRTDFTTKAGLTLTVVCIEMGSYRAGYVPTAGGDLIALSSSQGADNSVCWDKRFVFTPVPELLPLAAR